MILTFLQTTYAVLLLLLLYGIFRRLGTLIALFHMEQAVQTLQRNPRKQNTPYSDPRPSTAAAWSPQPRPAGPTP